MTTTMTEPQGAERAQLEAKRGLAPVRREYAVEGCEMRAASEPDSTIVNFYGHASVTNKGYDMYGGPDKGGWTEYVDKGSFKKTLGEKPDVAFLLNHAGLTLARTKAGTLQLAEDTVGLETKAQLDTRVSAVNDMVVLMEQGNLDEMSFAFRVMRQKWLNVEGEEVPWWDMAGVERHITEVSLQKGDVSVVNYGANPHTDAALRSLDEALRELTADRDSLDEADLRAAIDYFTSLLPADTESEEERAAVEATAIEAQRRAFLAKHAALT
jgi:HK97 family phage prohead protease